MSKDLKEYLETAKAAYYKGDPFLSDAQYDELELLYRGDLPVGAPGGRVDHIFRMYSLQKVYDIDDSPLSEFTKTVETPKLDGAAIALRYLKGTLHSVVTRGNGEQGEDISHLFQVIHPEMRIPKKIKKIGLSKDNATNGFHQITGEIVAPKRIKNARNYAAGALSLKDPREFYFKELEFFAYDLQQSPFETYTGTLFYLRDIGFNTPKTHDASHLPMDGIVCRVESNERYHKLGYTNKHPRGAFALKERTDGIETVILDVVWQTGKTGKVTPVAILKPIDIDGATVSRATLNNPGFIQALGVKIGDAVMVERAGGIIPRIIRKAE